MKTEEREKNLGDIITTSGKNYQNIKARQNRGRGIRKDLLRSLVEIFAGGQNHELGVTLRKGMLISSLLTNCESWYNFTIANIVALEKVDEQMLGGILNGPLMCPRALLYLEPWCLPIRFIIKSRMLIFLHYIMSQSEESLMKIFFNSQQENSTKTDWTYQVKIDLQELKIK